MYIPLRFNAQMEKFDKQGNSTWVRTSVTVGHVSERIYSKYSLGDFSTLQLKNILQAAYFNETGIWKEMETHKEFVNFRETICQHSGEEINHLNFSKASASFLNTIIEKTLSETHLDFDALNEKSKLFLSEHKYYGSYRKKIEEMTIAYCGSVRDFHKAIPKEILLRKAVTKNWEIKSINHQQEDLKEAIYREHAEAQGINQLLERDKTIAKMRFFESACISFMRNFPYTYGQVLGFLILGKSKELIDAAERGGKR